MLKSHNDYWNEDQIYDGINAGCDIIETDVVLICGQICNSHSWRPCVKMTFGSIMKYLLFFYHYAGDKKLYLYIEIKTRSKDIIPKLIQLLQRYNNPKVTYLISGIHGKRYDNALSIYYSLKDYMDIKFLPFWETDKLIDNVYLYKTLPWYKKLNHF